MTCGRNGRRCRNPSASFILPPPLTGAPGPALSTHPHGTAPPWLRPNGSSPTDPRPRPRSPFRRAPPPPQRALPAPPSSSIPPWNRPPVAPPPRAPGHAPALPSGGSPPPPPPEVKGVPVLRPPLGLSSHPRRYGDLGEIHFCLLGGLGVPWVGPVLLSSLPRARLGHGEPELQGPQDGARKPRGRGRLGNGLRWDGRAEGRRGPLGGGKQIPRWLPEPVTGV